MHVPVVFYVPNVLCYARILLAFGGLFFLESDPATAVLVWILSAFLDLFDGILARLLCQTSSFGVFLDILADNVLRTVVWVAAAAASSNSYPVLCLASFIVVLEWTTMLCTQLHAGLNADHWKKNRDNDPKIVQAFFASNFRNPLGLLGIYGLFASNLFLYASHHEMLFEKVPYFWSFLYLAMLGRAIAMGVEVYLCFKYFGLLLEKDSQKRQKQT